MRDHAVIRPHRGAFDVPGAMKHLEGAGLEPAARAQRFAHLHGLRDRGRVGHEDAAGDHDLLGVGHDLPRLGKVEQDSIHLGHVDALVAVAQLDVVTVEGGLAEHADDVLARSIGEVLADLVAVHVGSGPQQGHAECSRADAGFEHPGARRDVGQHEQGAEVLGVDDLSPSRHLEDEVLQRRAQRGVSHPPRAGTGGALGRAEEIVVGEHSVVAVELAAFGQGQQVVAALGVHEQHLVADCERAEGHPQALGCLPP